MIKLCLFAIAWSDPVILLFLFLISVSSSRLPTMDVFPDFHANIGVQVLDWKYRTLIFGPISVFMRGQLCGRQAWENFDTLLMKEKPHAEGQTRKKLWGMRGCECGPHEFYGLRTMLQAFL